MNAVGPSHVAQSVHPLSRTGHGHVQPLSEPSSNRSEKGELRTAFDQFVGQTFYSQMLAAMRQTVGEPAYFHGGRAEKAFQGQLDQILSEKLAESTSDRFTGPMFELFMLARQ